MKILLVSPKDPQTPKKLELLMGGENTYSENLLNHPPEGVTYIHYQQALKDNKIKYTIWQKPLNLLIKLRILPPDGGIQSLKIIDRFDLIHAHGYCLRLKNYIGPVILSDSSSNYLFLKGYLGWSIFRIKIAYNIRRFVSRLFRIYDQNLNLQDAPLLVWSKFAKNLHLKLGQNPKQIFVIPPGVENHTFSIKEHKSFTILFIGIWFQRKGGDLVLEAYKEIKKKHHQVRLLLISKLKSGYKLPAGVIHKSYLPRKVLFRDIFPQADVLILVPPRAEGYGMVVEEAASFGIPAIVTKVGALPEIVKHNKTGFIIQPGNIKELTYYLEFLITNPRIKNKMGRNTYDYFNTKFSLDITNKKLRSFY